MTLTSSRLRLTITSVNTVTLLGMEPAPEGFVFITTLSGIPLVTLDGQNLVTYESFN